MYNVEIMNTEKPKYPYLPEGREILFAPEENIFMQEAKRAARELSTDSLQPTGAVIVKDGEIIGRGANHTWAGKNKTYNRLHQKGLCTRKIFNVPSGKGYWACPGCVTNRNHAEASAVRDAKKNEEDTEGADLYLWGHWWCCQPCWESMMGAGIKQVFVHEESASLFQRGTEGNIIGKQFLDDNKN